MSDQRISSDSGELELITAKTEGDSAPALSRSGAGERPADAKELRTAAVGELLAGAYRGASMLKLTQKEIKELTEPFPDEAVEILPFNGSIYISHMLLRERLWKVFGPTEVSEIIRERSMSLESNEIMIDLVLMARGHFLAEAIGTSKWQPSNANQNKGDAIESAWSEAYRRCAKRIGVGTQVWRPQYIRGWLANNAVQFQGKWMRKGDPKSTLPKPAKSREYTLKEPAPIVAPDKEEDDEQIPF